MRAADQIEIKERSSAHNGHPLPVVPFHGDGNRVTDADGKKYIDSLSGYSASNPGHRHPAIVETAGRGWLDALVFENGSESWDICLRRQDHGILAKQTHRNVIRFAPPLVIAQDQIAPAVQRNGESL